MRLVSSNRYESLEIISCHACERSRACQDKLPRHYQCGIVRLVRQFQLLNESRTHTHASLLLLALSDKIRSPAQKGLA